MSEAIAEKITCPEPGIYRDIPSKEYHSWIAASKSALDIISEWSPAHLDFSRKHPEPPTDTLKVGSALHTSVLEPDKFDSEWTIATGCCERVKSTGAACKNSGVILFDGQWYCGVHGKGLANESDSSRTLTGEQANRIRSMTEAVMAHPASKAMIEMPGDNELSVVWDQPVKRMGKNDVLRCKMRCDGYRPGIATVFDVKTCPCASADSFIRSIDTYGYDRQAAMYQDGLAAHGIKIDFFSFVAVENAEPSFAAGYRMIEDAISFGRFQNDRLLEIYANCESAGYWPSYSPNIEDISVSTWRMIREKKKGF